MLACYGPGPRSAISSCSRPPGRSTRYRKRWGTCWDVHGRKTMDNVLDLVTTDQTGHKLKMIVVSWVHSTGNERYIEISATNEELGQLLVRITTTGGGEYQERLSEFHDKLLSALGRFDTQITAYTDTPTLPAGLLEIDLKTHLVYLIIGP